MEGGKGERREDGGGGRGGKRVFDRAQHVSAGSEVSC